MDLFQGLKTGVHQWLRDVTDFEKFRRFFTNPNLSDLQTCFLSDSDLIFVLVQFGLVCLCLCCVDAKRADEINKKTSL